MLFNGFAAYADSKDDAVTPVDSSQTDAAETADTVDDENRDRENFHRSGVWGYTLLADGTVAVSKYYGKDRHIAVPDTLDGCTVSAISGGWYMSGGSPVLYGNIHGISYADDGSVADSQVYSPFAGNTKIEQITVPDTVKQIGAIAFKGCTALTEVKLGEGVELIGNNCFDGCSALLGIDIPASCTYIDQQAFKDCTSLCAISMPNPHMEHSVFEGCTAIEDYTFPEGTTDIPPFMFLGCTGLKAVTFPEGLVTIGDSAFKDCTALEAFELPDTVTTIYNEAFIGCSALSDVKLGRLDTLGSLAFADCGLKDLTVPDTLVRIGENAFGKTSKGKAVEGFTLHCTEYSAAQSYAEDNDIPFKAEAASVVTSEASSEENPTLELAPNIAPDKLYKIIMGIAIGAAVAVLIVIILTIVNHKTAKGKEADEYLRK